MPPINGSPNKVWPTMLAVLLGCLGILATVSEVERTGLAAFRDLARATGPESGHPPLTVAVPASTGDSWIAFNAVRRDRAGTTALYVVAPDGTDLRQLHRDAPRSRIREWAEDGRSIVFCAGQDYSAGAPTTQCRQDPSVTPHLRMVPSITYLDSRPTRSPDGRTLAFVRIHDAGSHRAALMTVDIISGLSTTLVGFEANVQLGIDWSPDGRLLAYTSNPGGGPTSDLWVVAADGSQRRRLTHLDPGWSAVAPSFSPDGTRIATILDAGDWAEVGIVELAGSVPEPVVGFRTLVPQELDWGPSVGAR